jgi:hypothetical protein
VGRLDIVLRWGGEYEWGHPTVLLGGGGWVVSADGREMKRSQSSARPREGLRLGFVNGWDDLRMDGYPVIRPEGTALLRATRERTEIASRALATALRAELSYDSATGTTKIVGGHHKIVVTTGSSNAMVDGRAVRLTRAVRQEGGRQWVAAGVIFERLGYRAVADHQHWRLELYSGEPPAWLGTAKGPEGKSAELYLTSRGGVLLGEIRGLAAAIPGAEVATPTPGTGAPGNVKISLEKGSSSNEPHFEGGPAGSAPEASKHELWLTFGSTAARLDGKAYTLTAAPYVNPLGRGMAPVASVCKALGLTAAYSEGNRTVTVGD